MRSYKYDELRVEIMNFIRPKLARIDFNESKLTDKTDLLGEGILDSFDFIDLIIYLEDCTGIAIDLSKLNFDTFTTLGGLIEEAMSYQK
jgi:acyl carrier protein